jgi:hypothetical protein
MPSPSIDDAHRAGGAHRAGEAHCADGGRSPAAQPAFLPSRDGFAFRNAWPPAPALQVRTRFGSIGVGNAAGGLCGGMVFAALDYWHAGLAPPPGQPTPDSPLYRFIVRRLLDSWHLPAGVARYYRWMNLTDRDSTLDLRGRRVLTRPGVSRRTVELEWPRLRASLAAGVPAALGVVTVASANPLQLGRNHQVLGYGYRISGSEVALQVYDPNSGPSDDIGIGFDAATPAEATAFAHNLDLALPVRGFFVTAYSPALPPPAASY